jgi:hypothetical protein
VRVSYDYLILTFNFHEPICSLSLSACMVLFNHHSLLLKALGLIPPARYPWLSRTLHMMPVARNTPSPPTSPRPSKRVKLDDSEATKPQALIAEEDSWRIPVDYTNGVVLAPMVRSGSRKKVHFFSSCPFMHLPHLA